LDRLLHSRIVRDLRADISAEAGARQTYESLIKACTDEKTKKVLHHLLTREITHANMFMSALAAMGKLTDPMFGNISPDDTVKLVFNLSHGEDARGPWNEAPDFDYIADPQPKGGFPPHPSIPMMNFTIPKRSISSARSKTLCHKPRRACLFFNSIP
jgi:Mn-containing catalase